MTFLAYINLILVITIFSMIFVRNKTKNQLNAMSVLFVIYILISMITFLWILWRGE